ncbi:MAG TPA: ATP-binding cassette domain-containing protein, partial [Petrotogaceae bacterium]|nr:ATP-binding cassette domain-containing protein [Petrotogaceae bacterium]
MIEVSGISKKFKTKKKVVSALEDVSFSCEDGKIFGLLGPNGAGKTTALRIMATLLKPDSGSVKVSGYDTVKQSTEVRKRIGFLTSDMKLSGNLSPDELMNFFGELNHISKEQLSSTKEQLVRYLGMGDFVNKPVEKLSTGMKQKTSIAVSLIHN